MTGKVKSVMQDKGYGFISGDEGGEFFFHTTGCISNFSSMLPGKKVEFETVESPKGKRAEGVRLI